MADSFDEIALGLRQAHRRGLYLLTLKLKENRWVAYTETQEHGVNRGDTREAPDPQSALLAILMPGRAVPPAYAGDRMERLDAALGELVAALWDHLSPDGRV